MGLLPELRSAGLRLTARGDQLLVEPKTALTDELRRVIKARKADLLRELAAESPAHPAAVAPVTAAQELARQGVLDDLRDLPHVQRALRYRQEGDVVILTVGIRGVGTCELSVPAEKFDLAMLLAHLNGELQ